MRKLIIMIPCLNEAETLPITLADLPRHVRGYDRVEWLIVDDGSTDGTAEIAKAHGADHVLSMGHNQGLARAFLAGLEAALRLGAHTIVNTDADNQYAASSIPDLVQPILEGRALIVIGERPIESIEHFSPLKKRLQRIGSAVVRLASRTDIRDAPSGFRAIHWQAAIKMYVFNSYTYTLETIIQAGRTNTPVVSIPVSINKDLRPSRLIKSIWSYVSRSLLTIGRIFALYRPLQFFATIGIVFLTPGIILAIRFLYFFLTQEDSGHTQSLVFAAVFIVISVIMFAVGILADLMAANRVLLEDVRTRLLRREIELYLDPASDAAPRRTVPSPQAASDDHMGSQAGLSSTSGAPPLAARSPHRVGVRPCP
jgi:glycosyltransferase involved in cell wall biosynthesis